MQEAHRRWFEKTCLETFNTKTFQMIGMALRSVVQIPADYCKVSQGMLYLQKVWRFAMCGNVLLGACR